MFGSTYHSVLWFLHICFSCPSKSMNIRKYWQTVQRPLRIQIIEISWPGLHFTVFLKTLYHTNKCSLQYTNVIYKDISPNFALQNNRPIVACSHKQGHHRHVLDIQESQDNVILYKLIAGLIKTNVRKQNNL